MNKYTQNFIRIFDELLETKVIKSKSEAAEKLGYRPSTFTEITKGRSGISIEFAVKFCEIYNIDISRIIGTQINNNSGNFQAYKKIDLERMIEILGVVCLINDNDLREKLANLLNQ